MNHHNPDTEKKARWTLAAAVCALGFVVIGASMQQPDNVQQMQRVDAYGQPGIEARVTTEPERNRTWYATDNHHDGVHVRPSAAATAWQHCEGAAFSDRVRTYLRKGLFTGMTSGQISRCNIAR